MVLINDEIIIDFDIISFLSNHAIIYSILSVWAKLGLIHNLKELNLGYSSHVNFVCLNA